LKLIFLNLERTDLEIYATRNFEKDVIDMLRILPDFSIPFQKFIPSYQYEKDTFLSLISLFLYLVIILVINVKYKHMAFLV
jgi:hypothetical protein